MDSVIDLTNLDSSPEPSTHIELDEASIEEEISLLTPDPVPVPTDQPVDSPIHGHQPRGSVLHGQAPSGTELAHRMNGRAQGLSEMRLEIGEEFAQSGVGAVLIQKMERSGKRVGDYVIRKECPFGNRWVVSWQKWTREKRKKEKTYRGQFPYLLFLMQADELLSLVMSQEMENFVLDVKRKCPYSKMGIITVGLEAYLKNYKAQLKQRFGLDPSQLNQRVLDSFLSFRGVGCRHVQHFEAAADHILHVTSTFQKPPSIKPENEFLSIFGGCQKNEAMNNIELSIATQPSLSRDLIGWIHLIHTVPKIGPMDAYAIALRFPSFEALMKMLMNPSQSPSEKRALIENLHHPSQSGQRVGPVAAEALHNFFLNNQPDNFMGSS